MEPAPAVAIATQAALERDAMARRYHQANVSLMSRVWTRYLGFTSGMVLAMVGAVFILGRLQTRTSDVSAAAAGSEFSFKTESPGLILVGLGVLLMIVTILTRHEIDVKDSAIDAAGWPIQPASGPGEAKPAPFPTDQQEAAEQGPPASDALQNLLQQMEDDARNERLLPAMLRGLALSARFALAGADDLATLRSSRKDAGTQARYEAVAPDPFALEGSVQEDALRRVSRHPGGDLDAADAAFEQWLRKVAAEGSRG